MSKKYRLIRINYLHGESGDCTEGTGDDLGKPGEEE
mgnify:CR=1 FL=1